MRIEDVDLKEGSLGVVTIKKSRHRRKRKTDKATGEFTETETQYEMDPFERNRVRSTVQKVRRVILIRSDGSTEIVVAK